MTLNIKQTLTWYTSPEQLRDIADQLEAKLKEKPCLFPSMIEVKADSTFDGDELVIKQRR